MGKGAEKNMKETKLIGETELAEGRYVYCVVNNAAKLSLGNTGIAKAEVYTVPHKKIAAIVHACQNQPYQSKHANKVMEWILSHNDVVDRATEHFGTVIPFSFDTIVKGGDTTIKDFLEGGYEKFEHELKRLNQRAEYVVQIFSDQNKLVERILAENQDLRELKEKTSKMPERAGYLFRRKFELKLNDACNATRAKLADEFASQIKEHAEEMEIERKVAHLPENYKDKKLIAAFSCLVHEDNVKGLGQALGKISQEGYAVRFTGPWAPFSFVKLGEI
jgi:hypothetical protein